MIMRPAKKMRDSSKTSLAVILLSQHIYHRRRIVYHRHMDWGDRCMDYLDDDRNVWVWVLVNFA